MLGAVLRNTTNPTMLTAGYKVNVIPTEATAHVDGRFLPGFEDEFFATLAELCGENVSVEYVSKQQPWETPYDGDLVDAMSRSLLAEDPDAIVAPDHERRDRRQALQLARPALLRLRPAAAARRPRLHRPVPRRGRAGARRRAGVRRGSSTGSSTRCSRPQRLRSGELPDDLPPQHHAAGAVGPIRTRSSSQPPCSARSTSSLRTTLRGNSRENVTRSNSHSTPRVGERCSR